MINKIFSRANQANILNFLRKHWFIIFVIFVYSIFTAYYMWPSVAQCTNTVYGFGDNTAGPIWKYGVAPNDPRGGFIMDTNYPYGENLHTPVGYSLIIQSTLIWTLQKIAGPICGYNLVNMIGFLTAALAMYGFIKWLTKNRWIALLSGYAVSFAPYFQYKVGGHPSYGYEALLIVSVWMLLKSYIDRKRSSVIIFAFVTASCFYWDPYFSFLAFTLLFPVFLGIIIDGYIKLRNKTLRGYITNIKPVLIGSGLIVLLMMPLALVQISAAKEISTYVSGTRGDVMVDARNCGNLPTDYFVPTDSNYFAGKLFGPLYGKQIARFRHGCNPSEDNVSISLVVLFTVVIGGSILIWDRMNGARLAKDKNTPLYWNFLPISIFCTALFAIIMAMPPNIGKLRFPSYYLLSFVTAWRILAREFIIVNIALITLFAIILFYFTNHTLLRNRLSVKRNLFVLIGILVFTQYQAFNPFSGSAATFRYDRDIPEILRWVREQPNIKFIADYPLDKVAETEASTHYITAQSVHKKKILNSTVPNSPQEPIRFSIKDLTDPQALPTLRALGVDTLIIRGLTPEQINSIKGITLLRYQDVKDPFTGGKIAVARLENGPKNPDMLMLYKGFPVNSTIMKSVIESEYETTYHASAAVNNLFSAKYDNVLVCFDAKMAASTDTDTLNIVNSKNQILATIQLDGDYKHVTFHVNEGDVFYFNNVSQHNMRINNLGCGK